MSTTQVNLICPKCETQNALVISTAKSNYKITCQKCKRDFGSRVVKIRAKNSRQDKRANLRDYSVRVIDFSGGEDLIQFRQSGIADFELRSGDIAAFNYLDNKLQIIQNLTIGRYLSLKSGCSSVTVMVVSLVFLLIVLSLCVLGKIGSDLSSRPNQAPKPTPDRSTPRTRK